MSSIVETTNTASAPARLPGQGTVLFTRLTTAFRWDDAQIVARSLENRQQKVLLEDAADARYVASGHLVFVRRES
jgi:hypothetical protein